MVTVADAREWSLSRAATMLDRSVFQGNYRRRIQGLKGAAGSLGQLDILEPFFKDAVNSGTDVLIELFAHAETDALGDIVWAGTLEPLRLWAKIGTVEGDIPIDDIQVETITFESDLEVG